MVKSCSLILICCIAALELFATTSAVAQQNELVDPDADAAFEEALQLFDEGIYGSAFRAFERVYKDYPLNTKTTAAWLMAGKSLYRHGEYSNAIDVLSRFIREYPSSSYLADAQRIRSFAVELMESEQRRGRLIRLGILLPLDSESIELSQSMFNGIRIAVEEHNASGGGQMPIKMLFRDSGHRSEIAADATEQLVSENVDVIIGPLYSDEALAAAGVAEVSGVPLIAPLATDEEVSRDRPHVFQANPTISMRGRLMARFAVRSLRLDDFGVISEYGNELSELMSEAFEDEVLRLGANVAFVKLLPGASSWFRLLDHVKPDTLALARAVYLPITGGDAPTLIRAVLNELNRADIPMRILGNKEWHDVGAAQTASKFNTTYTSDFYVDRSLPATQSFIASFAALSDQEPTQLSYAGYDVARYVMLQLTANAGQPLHRALHQAPPYQGLGIRLDFEEGNVNEAIYYLRYRNGRIELLR